MVMNRNDSASAGCNLEMYKYCYHFFFSSLVPNVYMPFLRSDIHSMTFPDRRGVCVNNNSNINNNLLLSANG